jgi:hypothetical protein
MKNSLNVIVLAAEIAAIVLLHAVKLNYSNNNNNNPSLTGNTQVTRQAAFNAGP